MSEIFSPGSVAGPQGPSGAAGSLANVKSLTDNILPNLAQLFDYTRAIDGYTVNVDGTIGAFGGFSASPLIYCPGALYAITDIPIRVQPTLCNFALYDANGNFLETLTSFAGVTLTGSNSIPSNTVFPLPGTQTYVRFTWQDSAFGGSYGSAASLASASFAAGVTAPTIPSPYHPFGFDTVADVNVKDAAVLASANAAIAAALTVVPETLMSYALPGGPLSQRNLFNPDNSVHNFMQKTDGTLFSLSGARLATIYCPNATEFTHNIPIWMTDGYGIVALDAEGDFIEDLTGSMSGDLSGNFLNAGNYATLPGTQTYVRFSYVNGWLSPGMAATENGGAFFAGTTSNPPPITLTASPLAPGRLPANVRYGSQLTASDQSLDCTVVFNAFLATASSASPVELILDGVFNTAGLVISPNGYTTIRGLGAGSGISLIDNTPQDAIRIGAYTASVGDSEGAYNVTLPARTATNIILCDFTVNPNAQSGGNGQITAAANQPVSGAIAHATYGVILTSATNILVDNVTFLQATTYCLVLSNVGYAKVVNCKFISTGTLHDGVHIDGPSEDIGIMNCDFATGDDAIALNSPEGFGGDISRVTITNCRFNGSLSVMRAYASIDTGHMPTNNVHKIRNVSVSNCTGSVANTAFVIGIYGDGYSSTSSVDQIQDFLVENCTLAAPTGLAIIANTAGSITFRGVNFVPLSTQSVVAVNLQVGELVLDGVSILRNPDGNSAPAGLVDVGGTLGRLSLLNCRVVDEDGSSYTAIPYLIQFNGGTVAALQLEAVDLTHVTALVSTGGFANITALRGSGVMGTGAQVPDSVMDNNALYLSSNASGAPSIKLGGTAKRLTLA